MSGFGGAVKLTGESEYRAALKRITQNLKEVSSEMKLVSSSYDKNDKSVQALTSKQDVLNTKLSQQKEKLNTLKAQYSAMSSQYTDNTQKHNQLVATYDKEKAELEKIGKELGTNSKEYQEQKAKVDALEQEVRQSTEAQEANEKSMSKLRTEMNNAQADVNKTEKELSKLAYQLKDAEKAENEAAQSTDELGNAMDDLDDSTTKISGGFTVMKGAIANLIANGIQNAISAMQSLVGEAVDSADALYKFEQTMGFAGYDDKAINKAKTDMKDYADKTVYDLNTVANTTAQLAANGIKDYTGLTQAAGNLNAVAGGNADTFQSVAMMLTQTAGAGKLTTENWNQLADAIPGASGKVQEALKKAGAYTGDFRDAMAKGEITSKEFNKAIMELGNEPVAVEAATSVETFEGSVGNLQATFVNGFMEIYDTLGRENITGIINSINDVVGKLLDGLKTGIKWVIDNGDSIIAVLTGMAAGVGAYVAYTTALTVMKNGWMALTVVQKAVAASQAALNVVMSANPIGIVIAAVVALVAAFVVLWKKSEKFRNFWKHLWAEIKKAVMPVIKAISDAFSKAWDAVKKAWEKASQFFQAVWDAIKLVFSGVVLYYKTIFQAAWNAIKAIWNGATAFFKAIWEGIKAVFSAVGSWFKSKFQAALNGIKSVWNGITSYFSGIWSKVKSAFSAVPTYFRSQFQKAVSNIKNVFSGLVSFFSNLWSRIKNTFSSLGTKIGDAIGGGVRAGINKIITLIQNTLNKGIGLINGAIGLINKLPGVHVGKIGTLSLPRLATGAVLERGQVGLLEGDGAEAVVPLERNTKWIKRVADSFRTELGLMRSQNLEPMMMQLDYDETVNAFKEALSEMQIILDDETAGKFVEKTVTRIIYA